MARIDHDWLARLFFLGTVVLQLALAWSNPATNAFDDHFEPIFYLAEYGALPGKLDCWECYQPPVFYALSALVLKGLHLLGAGGEGMLKSLQLLNCIYGLAALWVAYLILRKLPLSDFARTLAFGILCFLPRLIYMGALHSNDTLSYLTVALCIYLLLGVLEGRRSLPYLGLLSLTVCLAIFTKYTAFSVIPLVAVTFALLPRHGVPPRAALRKGLLVLLVPLLLLGSYMLENKRQYGAALPFNTQLFDPAKVQARDPEGASFLSFKPWLFIDKPILWPGQVSSFWTLIHGSMWFDAEPKFLPRLKDEGKFWWGGYYNWLKGAAAAPPAYSDGVRSVRWMGSLLIALGLVPLFLMVAGLVHFLKKMGEALRSRDWQQALPLQMFAVLLFLNVAGLLQLVVQTPVFSAMKASYLLASLPAFGVFLALGIMAWEKHRAFRLACIGFFGGLFLLVGASTLQIALSLA